MRKSRFSEQQIREILARPDEGTPITQICRDVEISEATFYNWRKKYGLNGQTANREAGRPVAPQQSEPGNHRRLAQLEDENRRLKRMVVDMLLEKAKLQEALAKTV